LASFPRRLVDELTERASVLSRNGLETTCVTVALVAWEGEVAAANRQPALAAGLDVDDEPDGACITGCRARSLLVAELRFEPTDEETDCVAYGAFLRRRSARRRRFRSSSAARSCAAPTLGV
jgi:hypothetical protein